jgi:hypothetical protein
MIGNIIVTLTNMSQAMTLAIEIFNRNIDAIREKLKNVPAEQMVVKARFCDADERKNTERETKLYAYYSIEIKDPLKHVSDEEFVKYYRVYSCGIYNPKQYFGELCDQIVVHFVDPESEPFVTITVNMRCSQEQIVSFTKAHRSKVSTSENKN